MLQTQHNTHTQYMLTAHAQHAHLVATLQVALEDVHTDGKVSGVVGIRTIPTLWSEFFPLQNNRVKVDKGEENTLEFVLMGTHIKGLLHMRSR